jgi:hypothetical protein
MDDLGGASYEDRILYEIPDDRKMRLHASTSYRDINVRHWIQVLVKLSVPNPNAEEAQSQPLLFKEVMLDSKLCVLRAGALTEDLVTLPQYSERIQGDDLCLAWGDLPEYSQTLQPTQPISNPMHTFLELAKPTHIGKCINSIFSRRKSSQEQLSNSQKHLSETPKNARILYHLLSELL